MLVVFNPIMLRRADPEMGHELFGIDFDDRFALFRNQTRSFRIIPLKQAGKEVQVFRTE